MPDAVLDFEVRGHGEQYVHFQVRATVQSDPGAKVVLARAPACPGPPRLPCLGPLLAATESNPPPRQEPSPAERISALNAPMAAVTNMLSATTDIAAMTNGLATAVEMVAVTSRQLLGASMRPLPLRLDPQQALGMTGAAAGRQHGDREQGVERRPPPAQDRSLSQAPCTSEAPTRGAIGS